MLNHVVAVGHNELTISTNIKRLGKYLVKKICAKVGFNPLSDSLEEDKSLWRTADDDERQTDDDGKVMPIAKKVKSLFGTFVDYISSLKAGIESFQFYLSWFAPHTLRIS